MEEIISKLIDRGNELLNRPYKKIEFTGVAEADRLLNDLDSFPHAFVLASVMDRQIKAERAWLIPYHISNEIGGFEFGRLSKLELDTLRAIFKKKSLHRFNEIMAESFYAAIKLIHDKYNSDASNIWNRGNGE